MATPLRMLLDTNVYPALLEKENVADLAATLQSSHILIYGFDLVRKELRAVPRDKMHEGRNYRGLLLEYYDSLTQKRTLYSTPYLDAIAEKYLEQYSGGISKEKLRTDFRIVACASVNRLDIIVTEDFHSMVSDPALRCFEKVNRENGLRTPRFYRWNEFQKLV